MKSRLLHGNLLIGVYSYPKCSFSRLQIWIFYSRDKMDTHFHFVMPNEVFIFVVTYVYLKPLLLYGDI